MQLLVHLWLNYSFYILNIFELSHTTTKSISTYLVEHFVNDLLKSGTYFSFSFHFSFNLFVILDHR